jgi:hypothetical protein
MDTNELMELDEASLMTYIEGHIRKNGRISVVNAVAVDSNGDFDSPHDSDSRESRELSDDSSVSTNSDDSSLASDSSVDGSADSGNDSDNNALAIHDQPILGDLLPIPDRIQIHDRIDHLHTHCPPFNDMSTVFRGNPYGICDCDDFLFAVCLQDNNFVYFTTANHVIDFDEVLMKAGENIDSDERRSNKDLRKALYKKVFRALDFGALEPGERRRLPNCAVAKVRQIYPSESGYYMGFKER